MFRRILLVCLPLAVSASLHAKTAEWDKAHDLVQHSKYTEAIQILEKSDKDPDNLQLLGQAWMGLKEFKRAVDVLEKAASLAPKSSNVYLWLGRAWGRRAESNKLMAFSWARKAKDAFERAVTLDNKNREALEDLFEYYVEAPPIVGGGLDKAEIVAKQIAAIDPVKGERAMARIAKERQN